MWQLKKELSQLLLARSIENFYTNETQSKTKLNEKNIFMSKQFVSTIRLRPFLGRAKTCFRINTYKRFVSIGLKDGDLQLCCELVENFNCSDRIMTCVIRQFIILIVSSFLPVSESVARTVKHHRYAHTRQQLTAGSGIVSQLKCNKIPRSVSIG